MESKSVDLIYMDPPYFSQRDYGAFSDKWDDFFGYMKFMHKRLVQCHRLPKDTGTFYLHVDPTASHYLKVSLDNQFGRENFRNEIIWCYKTGGTSKKHFAKKHDIILFYSKSKSYIFNFQTEKSYNRNLKPYKFKGVKEYCDKIGWYTLVGMKDYWNIDMVGRTSKERVGYPTHKPLVLLERIIKASSNEGDLILDPFCGSGTTLLAAKNLGRKFIGIDLSAKAVELSKKRTQ